MPLAHAAGACRLAHADRYTRPVVPPAAPALVARRLLMLVLGTNVWLTLVVVPALFVARDAHAGPAWTLLVGAALVPLVVGALTGSSSWLLLGFPAALLMPLAVEPRLVSEHLGSPLAFTVAAAGIFAHCFGVATLLMPPAPRPHAVRALAAPLAPRWRRRERLYAAFALLSFLLAARLVHAVNFNARNRAYLRELYPARETLIVAVLNLGALALWAAIFHGCFLWLLKRHREGDRDLTYELRQLRADAARTTPRPLFYLSVAGALLFMGLFAALRYR